MCNIHAKFQKIWVAGSEEIEEIEGILYCEAERRLSVWDSRGDSRKLSKSIFALVFWVFRSLVHLVCSTLFIASMALYVVKNRHHYVVHTYAFYSFNMSHNYNNGESRN